MIEAEKKVWSTPKLRVFVRTKPEERVLAGCKRDNWNGPTTGNIKCRYSCRDECQIQSST